MISIMLYLMVYSITSYEEIVEEVGYIMERIGNTSVQHRIKEYLLQQNIVSRFNRGDLICLDRVSHQSPHF